MASKNHLNWTSGYVDMWTFGHVDKWTSELVDKWSSEQGKCISFYFTEAMPQVMNAMKYVSSNLI